MPVVLGMPRFFRYLEGRAGTVLHDPVLDVLPYVDLSIPLFVFLYGVIVSAVSGLMRHPLRLLRTVQAYLLLSMFRMVTMMVLTLEPPPGMVELHDPISAFFYPGREPFHKDLFFSGHTATVHLLFLAAPWPRWRPVLLAATVLVGAAVLVQHVHWTVDVVAAPLFSWLAWRASMLTMRFCGMPAQYPDRGHGC